MSCFRAKKTPLEAGFESSHTRQRLTPRITNAKNPPSSGRKDSGDNRTTGSSVFSLTRDVQGWRMNTDRLASRQERERRRHAAAAPSEPCLEHYLPAACVRRAIFAQPGVVVDHDAVQVAKVDVQPRREQGAARYGGQNAALGFGAAVAGAEDGLDRGEGAGQRLGPVSEPGVSAA